MLKTLISVFIKNWTLGNKAGALTKRHVGLCVITHSFLRLRFSQEAQWKIVNFASNFSTVFLITSELFWTKRANLITCWSILRNYHYLVRVLEYRNIVLYLSNSSTKKEWKFHLQRFLKSMAHKQTINFQCLNTLKGKNVYVLLPSYEICPNKILKCSM